MLFSVRICVVLSTLCFLYEVTQIGHTRFPTVTHYELLLLGAAVAGGAVTPPGNIISVERSNPGGVGEGKVT